MFNSRLISCDFEYVAPRTVNEALEYLQREGARVLAGGTDLLNNIKVDGLKAPALVYLLGVEELKYVRGPDHRGDQGRGDQGLKIGAAARLSDIEAYPAVVKNYPALREAINAIGGRQIRNMATLAGNLCNGSPGADTPPILLALGASVEILFRRGSGRLEKNRLESKTVALEDFFTGPKKTILEPGQLLGSVSIPTPAACSGQSFRRLARVCLDIAKINCAVYLVRAGETIEQLSVFMGSVAPTPVRTPAVEKALVGKKVGVKLLQAAAARVGDDIAPIDDVRSTARYRNKVAPVLVLEALKEAWKRSGGN